ncbi:MAG: hypothetical protein WDW38_011369 [Sanguina aurantia]
MSQSQQQYGADLEASLMSGSPCLPLATQSTMAGGRNASLATQSTMAGERNGSLATQSTIAGGRNGSLATQSTIAGGRIGSVRSVQRISVYASKIKRASVAEAGSNEKSGWVIYPSDRWYTVWRTALVIVSLLIAVFQPLIFAFAPSPGLWPYTDWAAAVEYICLTAFAADTLLGFFCGLR